MKQIFGILMLLSIVAVWGCGPSKEKVNCQKAVDHTVKLVSNDPALDKMSKELMQPMIDKLKKEAAKQIDECIKNYNQKEIDCVMSAKVTKDLAKCRKPVTK